MVSAVSRLTSCARQCRCIGQPFTSQWEDAYCRYFDTGMFISVWGIFIMPPAILLATLLFLIGRL